ncbi:nucleoside deaminase [bacterium]|nr:nucleoside deaminase [bacterium]|tara:strand:- start:5714 stop:6130 length:417 start_codon:yes stop_codon:yes gene_type:complete
MNDKDIKFYLNLALSEAEKAENIGEVPIGAIVVNHEKTIVGKGHNLTEKMSDPTAHAEIIAIQNASKKNGDWRLNNFILISTIEPCPMCLAAAKEARINRIYFGHESNTKSKEDNIILSNLKDFKCEEIMKQFFKVLR